MGKVFARDFERIDEVGGDDKFLVYDEETQSVKYANPGQFTQGASTFIDNLNSEAHDVGLSANMGRVLKDMVEAKQDELTAGQGIAIDGNVISATGEGGSSVEWNQLRTEGSKIATITIDGETTDVYAPTGGGGGGTTDYSDLTSKPQINSVTLEGNKTAAQLGLATATEVSSKQDAISDLSTIRSGSAAGATAVQPATLTSALAGKQNTLTAGEGISIDGNVISAIAKAGGIVDVTYDELVNELIYDGNLIPGQLYRITDYVTTTVQENTRSAGHTFNIIVLALGESRLAEDAWCEDDGQGYFDDARVEAWRIKYDIENATSRYAWADPTNGKGVIYWMRDEWGNEAPYDFKNIQFCRWKVSDGTSGLFSQLDGKYAHWSPNGTVTILNVPDELKFAYAYTFSHISSTSECVDMTVTPAYRGKVTDNVIKTYFSGDSIKRTLNGICVVIDTPNLTYSEAVIGNTFGNDCHNITLCGDGFKKNSFGAGVYNVVAGLKFRSNVIGEDAHELYFNQYCADNKIGSNVENAYIGYTCKSNSIGDGCHDLWLYQLTSYNHIGHDCYDIYLYNTVSGKHIYYNEVGDDCHDITMYEGCHYNTIGGGCSEVRLNAYFENVTICGGCSKIEFKGAGSESTTYYGYAKNVTVESGVIHVIIKASTATSESAMLLNARVCSGVRIKRASFAPSVTFATSDTSLEPPTNMPALQMAAANSSGVIKVFNIADLIQ